MILEGNDEHIAAGPLRRLRDLAWEWAPTCQYSQGGKGFVHRLNILSAWKPEFEPERRVFFFEKEAKNFCLFWLRLFRIGSAQTNESFLVLFFKKELLPSPRRIFEYPRRRGNVLLWRPQNDRSIHKTPACHHGIVRLA
jgi:hypothetical protein